MRIQDAVPDELEIIPEGEASKHATGHALPNKYQAAATVPIPITVVQKVEPASPSHGEVPGTAAHSIRKADAIPDVIIQVNDPGVPSVEAQSDSKSASVPFSETGNASWDTVSSKNEDVMGASSDMRWEEGNLNTERETSKLPSKSSFG